MGVMSDLKGLRRDGSEFPIDISLSTVEVAAGRRILVFVRDMGERAKLEDRLQHAQSTELVRRLAGNVAHHFNNLLTTILGTADLLLTENGPASRRARADVLDIRRAALRAARLTPQLLSSSGTHVIEPQPLDVGRVAARLRRVRRRVRGP